VPDFNFKLVPKAEPAARAESRFSATTIVFVVLTIVISLGVAFLVWSQTSP